MPMCKEIKRWCIYKGSLFFLEMVSLTGGAISSDGPALNQQVEKIKEAVTGPTCFFLLLKQAVTDCAVFSCCSDTLEKVCK